jgi:hypothetical protein
MALWSRGVSDIQHAYFNVKTINMFFHFFLLFSSFFKHTILVDNQDFRLQQYSEAFRLFGAESIGRAWGAKGRNSPFYYMCNGTVMRFPVCAFCEVFTCVFISFFLFSSLSLFIVVFISHSHFGVSFFFFLSSSFVLLLCVHRLFTRLRSIPSSVHEHAKALSQTDLFLLISQNQSTRDIVMRVVMVVVMVVVTVEVDMVVVILKTALLLVVMDNLPKC